MSMMTPAPPPDPLAQPPTEVVPLAAAEAPQKILRDRPEPDAARAALVKELCKWATDTKEFRRKTYAKMRRDMDFVRPGRQWASNRHSQGNADEGSSNDSLYECNLVQRHIQQRVAALYAKNPKVVARRRKRLDFQVWDGEQQTLQAAIQRAQGEPPRPPNPATGDPGSPGVPPAPTPEDQQLIADVAQGMNRRKMLDRISTTLEVLFRYYMNEGTPNFKIQAKQLIRRVETTGVGFVQLGFQRVMQKNPEIVNRIRDDQTKIEYLTTLAQDVTDEKVQEYERQIEELRGGMTALQAQSEIVVREGLVFDFPQSTDIIVDRDCTQLKGLIGARRVAREYRYSKDQVKMIFNVDLGTNYTQYEPQKSWQPANRTRDTNIAVIWAIWDAFTGLTYYACDGYPDFLKEPEAPEIDVEGVFPFYVLTFNDLEDPNDIYPPSDVETVRPMQLEYNRSREALREHRIANKPGYVTSKGMLDDEDKTNLQNHASNEVIELNLPAEAIKEIEKYIAARPTVPIQEPLYDTEYLYQDLQRVSGDQEANLGGTSGSTATEASIAETSRVSSLQSCIDDLDDFLSVLARAGGQVLLKEMSPEQVTKIVGPGAVWPAMSREEIAEEIYLEVEGGSSGRPNKALEISNWERLIPYLIQMPGIDGQWLLKETVKRLDDNLEIEDAFSAGLPSVVAQNTIAGGKGKQMQPGTGDASTSPDQQGPSGAMNAIGVPKSMPGPKGMFPTAGNEPGGPPGP